MDEKKLFALSKLVEGLSESSLPIVGKTLLTTLRSARSREQKAGAYDNLFLPEIRSGTQHALGKLPGELMEINLGKL